MIILGSQSPRRKEILSFFSIPFQQVASDFDESSIPWEKDPISYSLKISQAKARAFKQGRQPILTADTIVYKNNQLYLKPKDEKDAFNILNELANGSPNGWHSVFTAVTLKKGDLEFSDVEETRVLFNPLSDFQIDQFIKKLPYKDKAGAYFIQNAGSLLIKKIDGCFYNVMGLPINTVQKLFSKINIDLWNFLRYE